MKLQQYSFYNVLRIAPGMPNKIYASLLKVGLLSLATLAVSSTVLAQSASDESEKAVSYDYDGDGKADVGVRRPTKQFWYIHNSDEEQTSTRGDNIQRVKFGLQDSDIPVSGDFDGDSISDIAVRRPSTGIWYILNSSGTDELTGHADGISRKSFGSDISDIPVAADYDGDGKTDIAVYRPEEQVWHILNSSGVDSLSDNSDGISRINFGESEDDLPVPADYDGDGKADLALRNNTTFEWRIRNSSGIDFISNNNDGISRRTFGRHLNDIAVPADYDGDGKADLAVRRPTTGLWYVLNSSGSNHNSVRQDGIQRIRFGRQENDIPIVADYDGDGYADFAVRRAGNFHQYILNSSGVDDLTHHSDGISRLRFGLRDNDIPLAAPIWQIMKMLPCEGEQCDTDSDNTPRAQSRAYSTDVNTPIDIMLEGSDDNDAPLTYRIATQPEHGTLTGTPPALTYTPDTDHVGRDVFTFTVDNGQQISEPAEISIEISGEDSDNSPPVATEQSLNTIVNTALAITVTGTDADGDTLTYDVSSQPQNGTLSGTLPSITYTPAPDFVGSDSFTFTANDGEETSTPATVSITVQPAPPSNTAPIAAAQSLSTNMDEALTISLTGTDADGDTLTYALASQPQNGTLSGTPPSLTYTPGVGFVGNDSFAFTVNDGQETSAPATVSITVQQVPPSNTTPIATAQSLSTNMNEALAISLTGTDADGDTLTYALASQPQNGTLSGTPPSLTYTPDTGFMGSDAFTFTVNDGQVTSAPATVSINVVMGNDNSHCLMHEMIPDFATDPFVTHIAVTSGNWSSPATWGGTVPPAGAVVKIPEGISVNVASVLSTRYETIRIDGVLSFSPDKNTELKVDTMVSSCGGHLQIGTAAEPVLPNVMARVLFIDDGAVSDNAQIGRGAVLLGKTTIYGATKTHRAIISPHARQGDTELNLTQAPTGWRVGDELVITGTVVNDPKSDEVRTISAIDGTRVTLNTALALDHTAPKTDLNVYVANMTRNVEFVSENPTLLHRGHIMFMHTLDVNVHNAMFNQLGRTDKTRALDDVLEMDFEEIPGNFSGAKAYPNVILAGPGTNIRGRYAIHFHRGGIHLNRQPAIMKGSVVNNSPGWGFVTHSSYADFIDNVSYDVQGTAFYTEAGDEVGTMRGNIAIRTVNDTFRLEDNGTIDPDEGRNPFEGSAITDFGHQGDGFWLAGNMVAVIDNVVSGTSAHGIIYWVDGIVEPDLTPYVRSSVKVENVANNHLIPNRDRLPVWYAPLAQNSGNEVYNSIIGLRSRYMHTQTYYGEGGSPFHERPPQAYIDTLNPTIDSLTAWNVRDGVMLNYNERMGIKNSRLIGIGVEHVINLPGTSSTGIGLDMANHVTRGPGRVDNVSIENFSMGFMVPTNDQWVISNMTLNNTVDMWINNPFAAPRTLTMQNISFQNSSEANVQMSQTLDNILLQPNYFVMPDHISINGQGVYYTGQAADFVPGTPGLDPEGDNPNPSVPGYFSKSNQQLQNEYGLSFGGRLIPAGATEVDWIEDGLVGPMPPAATRFPPLYDMTGEGYYPEPAPGNTTPELTRNFMRITNGGKVTLMADFLNTTDTNTGPAELVYTVSDVVNGYFAHRDNAPDGIITSFTQAEIDGGVIQFRHDGNGSPPDYSVTVTDGNSTTTASAPIVEFINN